MAPEPKVRELPVIPCRHRCGAVVENGLNPVMKTRLLTSLPVGHDDKANLLWRDEKVSFTGRFTMWNWALQSPTSWATTSITACPV